MNRIRGLVVSLLAVGTAVVASLPACKTNDQSIFVHSILAPSANRSGGACVYSNDPAQAGLFEATLDVGLTTSYLGTLIVGNQLISRGDPLYNRAESNRAHLDGAVVKVTELDGTSIAEFTSLATGFADTAANNVPGYGVVGVVLIDTATSNILRPQLKGRSASKTVLITLRVFGTTIGGEDLESGDFQVPMNVCNGCLINFGAGDDPAPSLPQPNCAVAPTSDLFTATTGPCAIGQDLAVDCRICVRSATPQPKICDPSVNP